MGDKANVAETSDEDPRGGGDSTATGENHPRDSPETRLREAHKQAGIAEADLDADSDAAQYARITGTVIEWALDELDALDEGADPATSVTGDGDGPVLVFDHPCDWTDDPTGEPCGATPTAYVGDIYYACEDHLDDVHEWLVGDDEPEPVTDGGKAIDTSRDIGDRVTYFDADGEPHNALVTWIFGDGSDPPSMINCVRGEDFELGETDATGGDYGHRISHETSVQHRVQAGDTHVYVRGWLE